MTSLHILESWIAGEQPTLEQQQILAAEELAVPARAKAFAIDQTNAVEMIAQRAQLFQAVYTEIKQLCDHAFGMALRAPRSGSLRDRKDLHLSTKTLDTLWHLWLPWAILLAKKRKKLDRPLIQGILGGQGTGKTTLAAVTRLILHHFGYSTLDLSLDDLYKTYAERQQLQTQDPRLIWRGPPGTHDVKLGIELLDQLRQGKSDQEIYVPRFDKSAFSGAGERTTPEPVKGVDIVLFEGWFVGVQPISESAFEQPPEPIISPEDRNFAQEMNQRLQDYVPLWERLDSLMVLYPTDYRFCKQWRREAEHKMMATGKSGMSDEEINRFVEYFWQALHPDLFIKPLVNNSELVDLVIEIDVQHFPGRVYQP